MANAVVIFNMDTCISKVIKLGEESVSYSRVVFDGASFWLAVHNKNAIAQWTYETRETTMHTNFPDEFKGAPEKNNFSQIIYFKNKIWAFPLFSNMVLCIDLADGSISCNESFYGDNMFSSAIGIEEDNIYAFDRNTEELFLYNHPTQTVKKTHLQLQMPDIDRKRVIPNLLDNSKYDDIYHENENCNILDFLLCLENLSSQYTSSFVGDSIGKRIYMSIRDRI